MSYDRTIGLGHNSTTETPVLSEKEIGWLQKLGVSPLLHDLKSLLPKKDKEPEPKLLLPNTKSFGRIRQVIQSAPNAFMIPGQIYSDDHPLVSLLLDTRHHKIPTCDIVSAGYSLRWRANMDPKTGRFSQRDFNEKSTAITSDVIGGCIDRDEREYEYGETQANKEGYLAFLEKYRALNNPAFCDSISYEQLNVYAGYMTARTMYGFAVKHPQHDVLLICEACEDHTQTFAQDMQPMTSYKEFEFEPKQIVGNIPSFARTPEAFKLFLYGFMRDIQASIQARVHGSDISIKSKADFAREHLENCCVVDQQALDEMGLAKRFQKMTSLGHGGYSFIPERAALFFGQKLDDVIANERGSIHQMASKLVREKRAENSFIKPDEASIGRGFEKPLLSTPIVHPERRLHLY